MGQFCACSEGIRQDKDSRPISQVHRVVEGLATRRQVGCPCKVRVQKRTRHQATEQPLVLYPKREDHWIQTGTIISSEQKNLPDR